MIKNHWLFVASILLSLQSRGGLHADELPANPIFQGFDLQNDGLQPVTEVKIVYGSYVFPTGFQSPIVGVAKFKGTPGFHQTATVSVPKTALIHWKSFDNQTHEVEVPIRSLVLDWKMFRGFKFTFIDDHVELSVTSHHEKPLPYGYLSYTKAYSSMDGLIDKDNQPDQHKVSE